MQLKSPADELAEIRAEIARLRIREGELREILLRDAEMPKVGRMHKVDLVTQRHRIFDPRLLPEDIRLDPAYTREKVTRVLRASRKPAPSPAAPLPETQSPRARLFVGQTAH